MSFEAVRNYGRHILQPLGLFSTEKQQSQQPRTKLFPQTKSNLWQSSTHTFFGAANRVSPAAWPATRFHEDANKIPFDIKYDKSYDPQTANVRQAAGGSNDADFWLYERETEKGGNETDDIVPQPILVVKRYIPSTNKAKGPGLTLLMLSGMGVPKEMFEPMLEVMLPILASNNVVIDEIWSLDMPMSGETALANPPSYLYGNEKDITRDVLHFITAYLPVKAQKDLPERLEYRLPKSNGRQESRENLHVIAHSMGAQSAILAAVHAPQLFSSLTIFDPAIVPPGKVLEGFVKLPNDVFCTLIPEHVQSRDALREIVGKNKRTNGWDKRAVEIYVEKGTIEDKERGGIKLTSPPRLEWALYYDKETPVHTFDRLQDLQTPLNAIMPSRPFATPPKLFEKIFNAFPQDKRLVWLPNTTHQLVYERIDDCAHNVCEWLKSRSNDSAKPHL